MPHAYLQLKSSSVSSSGVTLDHSKGLYQLGTFQACAIMTTKIKGLDAVTELMKTNQTC